MDDYAEDVLTSARDEYLAQLIRHMERCVMPWLDEVFAATNLICAQNYQPQQYLAEMQAAMSEVKDWNAVALEKEQARVLRQCPYMADLLTCTVVTLIKLLSCGRTTDRRKNIRVETPPLAQFVHRVYLNVARQIFIYPFLFEYESNNLQRTKQRAERERTVRGCILDTVRNGMGVPTEDILRAYLDESVENEEQVFIEPLAPPERDEVEELENAKRRALGQEPLHPSASAAAASESNAAVMAMRRNPSSVAAEQDDQDAGIGRVSNMDDKPIVSRVEFNPHEQVYPIPARGSYGNDDDDDGYASSSSEVSNYDAAAPVAMDMESGLVSIDDMF